MEGAMEGSKKVAVAVILLALIVGAVVFIVKRQTAQVQPPERVLNQPVKMIDESTLEVMTKTFGEWDKLGRKSEGYKNPKTGTYTMVPARTCPHCGKDVPIPYPIMPSAEDLKKDPGAMARRPDIKCPGCGAEIIP
jgi:hypothetical protein